MLALHLLMTPLVTGLVAGLLMFPGTAEAYPGHGERPGRMAERLDLTDEQREALRAVRAAHREAMAEARASGDSQRMREQARAMREGYAEVLTDDQLETLREARAARGEWGKQRIDRMVERLTAELELHSSQVEPVRDILRESFGDVRQRMHELAEEAERDRAAMRGEWQRMAEEARERLSAILTPAQLEQYDALRSQPRVLIRRRERG